MESERGEDDTKTTEVVPSVIEQRINVQGAMDITLPYLPNTMVTMDDMLEKVLKLSYSDHDVCDATKFPYLAEETYLENTREIGPLGKSIMDPAQWITRLYNYGIMNLLYIPHFRCGKNVGLCVKQLLSWVHGGILWMDRPVQLDAVLITKIIGLPTIDTQLEEYLDNKAREKEIIELVKVQFGTRRGNRGIVLKDINDNAKRLSIKLMDCKILRK
jgi:hypothetical protein